MTRFTAVLLTTVAMSSAAFAADVPIMMEPEVVAPAALWDGPYIGVHGGLVFGDEADDQSEFFDDIVVEADSFDLSGWLFGAHAGINFQSGSLVFGLEGVVDVGTLDGDAIYDYGEFGGVLSFSSDWQASLNARAGVAVDALLIYGSFGIAFADGTLTDETDYDGTFEDSATQVGWTIAAGLEYMFDENWSGRLEARYSDFGEQGYDLGFYDDVTASFSQTSITVGLSYHF